MDYADARKRMVDGQLRPNRVTDMRVLDAMRELPREDFLPPPGERAPMRMRTCPCRAAGRWWSPWSSPASPSLPRCDQATGRW